MSNRYGTFPDEATIKAWLRMLDWEALKLLQKLIEELVDEDWR